MTTPAHRGGRTAAEVAGLHAASAQAQADELGPPQAPPTVDAPADRSAPDDVDIVRSSGVMALCTIASRGTGFLRNLVLLYALGLGTNVANYYNSANTLPNAVYDLLLGGVLTSVVVPLLVNAAKRDADRGEAYDQRMFTLGAISLLGLTAVATLAASLLVSIYAHSFTGNARHLTVVFAYFFIPQIFFYGMSSLIGGILNARGRFAAPMWTPVVNNVVVIVVLLLFMAEGGLTSPNNLSSGQVTLLGFGTTLGIVAQTAALFPFLRGVGFRWRPRFDFRRDEVREIVRMAAPLFGYIATTQVSFFVVLNVATTASTHVTYDGITVYNNAWQLFQLPYAIVGISVITALLPRMSAHAAERRYAEVKSDFSGGVRLSSVIVAPAALLLFVLGAPVALALLGYSHNVEAHASYLGTVFGIFALGLVPYMMFQLMLRVFYALHDARTPMYIGVAVMAVNIAVSLLSLNLLPQGHVIEGVAVAFGLGNLVGTVLAWRILSSRMRGLGGRTIARGLIRMHAAAVPAAVFALAVSFAVRVVLAPGPAFGIVTVVIGGSGAMLLYVMFTRAMGVTELDELTSGLRARLGR